MYVIDSNIYISGRRDSTLANDLRRFLDRAAGQVLVSAVVIHELLVGAHSSAGREMILREVVTPFQHHLRVVETDLHVWREAALIATGLRAVGGYAEKLALATFGHDILIAASCRRVGATLITANRSDFALIDSVRGFRFVTSFPA